MTEPHPADPTWPRYAVRPFPSYHFVPGKNPHPRRDPRGHSYGKPEPKPSVFQPEDWHHSEEYLYGIDLYNFAFWWECHEIFEGLWHAVGHNTEQGNFFQSLILLAAANLKLFTGNHQAARKLLTSGMIRLQKIPRFYMGIDVAGLNETLRRHVADSDFRPPLIRLHEQNLI
jgi:uncharacterized protein